MENKVQQSETGTFRKLPPIESTTISTKSVIEEWQNPRVSEGMILGNEELYEERPVDVIFQPLAGEKKPPSSQRETGTGTVRSIPIKDYRSSLAQDMGSLRRVTNGPETSRSSRSSRYQRNSRRSSQKLRLGRSQLGENAARSCNSQLQKNSNHGQSQNEVEIDIELGNVGQKISAYEEASKRVRSLGKPKKQIGVPLVGMHNACGLPIVASNRQILSLQRDLVKKKKKKKKLMKKRKAPDRPSNFYEISRVEDDDYAKDCLILPVRSRRKRGENLGDPARRVTTTTFPAKLQKCSRKSSFLAGRKGSSIGSRRSKRRTLYAKDEGDEAIKVLSHLCLNPLARVKGDAEMIW